MATAAQWAGWIVAIATVLALLGKFAAVVLAGLRKLGEIHTDWVGEPARPGVPMRPGMVARVAFLEDGQAFLEDELAATRAQLVDALAVIEALRSDLVAIRDELRPNGGSSLRDAVDRVAARISAPVSAPPAAAGAGVE